MLKIIYFVACVVFLGVNAVSLRRRSEEEMMAQTGRNTDRILAMMADGKLDAQKLVKNDLLVV